jgi:hypothetical protein
MYEAGFVGVLNIEPPLDPIERARLMGAIDGMEIEGLTVNERGNAILVETVRGGRSCVQDMAEALAGLLDHNFPLLPEPGRKLWGAIEVDGSDTFGMTEGYWKIEVRSPTALRILNGRHIGIQYDDWEDGEPVCTRDEIEEEGDP